MPYLLPVIIVVVLIPPTNALNLVMKRSVRRLEKLARRSPMMVVVDEEVEVVVVVAVAVVVAVINKVAGMVLVTLQEMQRTKVSSASTVYG
jgi:hypothetical protein